MLFDPSTEGAGEKLPFLFSFLSYLFSGKVAWERLEKSEEYKKKKPLARLFFLERLDKKDAYSKTQSNSSWTLFQSTPFFARQNLTGYP